jgi:hypothetical protein
MSASSPTARSVGLALGSALAVAAVLFAAFAAFSGPSGTTDSKPPRPHTAATTPAEPTEPGTLPAAPATDAPPAASSGPAGDEPACKLFDTECQEEHPSQPVAGGEDGTTSTPAGTTPRVPAPPQGTAATGGGGAFAGTE